MTFDELIILLPCQNLDELTGYREENDALELLAGWSALWHPALLAHAKRVPAWHAAESPPEHASGRLYVIPTSSEWRLPSGWVSEAEGVQSFIVWRLRRREEIVAAALGQIEGGSGEVAADLAADFLALGFCHLQIQLLTRHLHYTSYLDEARFQEDAVAAAEAAMLGDEPTARDRLHKCFDLLTQAREYFYPVQTHLVDLTLVGPTTLGETLRRELAAGAKINLMVSGRTVEEMADKEPSTLAAIRAALEQKQVSLVGGEFSENDLPLAPIESILRQLRQGAAVYTQHLGQKPTVFGRRHFGLSPVLPQILQRSGFAGAIHITMDGGRLPKADQSKIDWTGLDGSELGALAEGLLDASQAASFFSLPERLSKSLQTYQVSTVLFVHWPGQAGPWYEDLRRIAAYGPVLGQFMTLGDYFAQTDMPGNISRFSADRYRSPYLEQAVDEGARDPISRYVRLHRRTSAAESENAIATLASLLSGRLASEAGDLLEQVDQVAETKAADTDRESEVDNRLATATSAAIENLSAALPRAKASAVPGYLVVNPHSFARRVEVDVSRLAGLPDVTGPILAAQESGASKAALVQVPPMGFAWVAVGSSSPAPSPVKLHVEQHLLRNEHFEVKISPETGAIQSLHGYNRRGNRLSQQIALRMTDYSRTPYGMASGADEDECYSTMVADSVAVVSPGPAMGEIVSRGRLVDRGGRSVAGFRQTMRLWQGSRILLLDLELDVEEEPGYNPWASYYAARFAWSDATTDLRRGVSLSNQPTDAENLESPHFVEIEAAVGRATILTGGLPFHRRIGLRKLDTLLVVRGETARKFRLGIGIDLAHPIPAALDLLAPATARLETAAPPAGSASGWLFHVDARNVVATHWEPLASDGRVEGFRVRLLETEGRPTRLALGSFRKVATARQVDFQGATVTQLPIEEDKIRISMGGCQWVEIEARWTN
ncbi:MAG: glycoside hydrolase family 38 N-terminal domain-containing protein [Pirellulales bacterium]